MLNKKVLHNPGSSYNNVNPGSSFIFPKIIHSPNILNAAYRSAFIADTAEKNQTAIFLFAKITF